MKSAKIVVCVRCGSKSCPHSDLARQHDWICLQGRLLSDYGVDLLESLKREIVRLMSGGPLGDGIGPMHTIWHLYRVHGFSLSENEVWSIWRQDLAEREGR